MKTTNKVIKECIICGNGFEDKTKPKNKKTCSRKCGDEARKARQREEYRKENPPKPNQRQLYYYDHYEYAFWNTDENTERNQRWKEAVPYDPEKIESIAITRQMEEYHGGRKRHQEVVSYNGDEKGSHGVNVQFVEHNREPSEVTSYKMTPAELKEYLASKKSR